MESKSYNYSPEISTKRRLNSRRKGLLKWKCWCSNKKSCMGVAGEGGWSKDGETQDVKPETASTEELG